MEVTVEKISQKVDDFIEESREMRKKQDEEMKEILTI